MIAGGCALPCAYDEISLLETLVHNITAAFPDADQYIVPYDDSMYQAQVSTPLMVAAAEDYLVSCPNTPIVFIGYSLGGVVVMNTLCGQLPYASNVIASIVSEHSSLIPNVIFIVFSEMRVRSRPNLCPSKISSQVDIARNF